MNPRNIAIVMLYIAGIALGIAGVVFLIEAGGYMVERDRASRLMTNGYVCVAIGSVLFLVASVLAFIAGSRSTPRDWNLKE